MASGAKNGVSNVAFRVLSYLLLIGFVLGMWKYFGHGVGIGSPDFFPNVVKSAKNLMHWGNHVVQHNAHTIEQHVPHLPLPSGLRPATPLPTPTH